MAPRLTALSCLLTTLFVFPSSQLQGAVSPAADLPLLPVQHPALVSEWLEGDPPIYDLGYFHLEAEPCLPDGPHTARIQALLSLSRPLTTAESAMLNHYRREQLQHNATLKAADVHWCYYVHP